MGLHWQIFCCNAFVHFQLASKLVFYVSPDAFFFTLFSFHPGQKKWNGMKRTKTSNTIQPTCWVIGGFNNKPRNNTWDKTRREKKKYCGGKRVCVCVCSGGSNQGNQTRRQKISDSVWRNRAKRRPPRWLVATNVLPPSCAKRKKKICPWTVSLHTKWDPPVFFCRLASPRRWVRNVRGVVCAHLRPSCPPASLRNSATLHVGPVTAASRCSRQLRDKLLVS